MLLVAHQSNFKIIGFTEEPVLEDLTKLAHQHNLPLMVDLGSGALLDTAKYGLAHESTVQETLSKGADLVCFSGDKLLGGPQAGILVGKNELLAKIRRHPLYRAIRVDKLCLAALSATLLHYLKGEAEQEIPLYQMLSRSLEDLTAQVQRWIDRLQDGSALEGLSDRWGRKPARRNPAHLPVCIESEISSKIYCQTEGSQSTDHRQSAGRSAAARPAHRPLLAGRNTPNLAANHPP